MKYQKLGACGLKSSENWATQMQVMPFRTNMCLSQPYSFIINPFEACHNCCQANPVCSMSSWTKLHLNGLEIVLLIPLKKSQSPIFHMWPWSKPFLFQSQSPHYCLLHFHLLYNIFDYFHWLSFDVILNYSSNMQRIIS